MSSNSSGGYGPQMLMAVGQGASDIFAGFGDIDKMKADELESGQYDQAAEYAGQEAEFSQHVDADPSGAENPPTTMAMGSTASEVAGAGFAASGSALDIMRSNAQQGSLAQAVTSEQGRSRPRATRNSSSVRDHGDDRRQRGQASQFGFDRQLRGRGT